MDLPADWLRPDWPVPAHVRALCTTRTGGVSAAPYDTLNLGDHVGDAPAAVAANRQRLQGAMAADAAQSGTQAPRPVFLQQVHRFDVAALDAATPDSTVADACLAQAPGVACTIMVADCLPVLFTNRQGTAVAAAHAGWRGLAGENGIGVLETVLERFRVVAQAGQAQAAMKSGVTGLADVALPQDAVLAWLGPCIGPTAFEVGAEVRAAFCTHDPAAAAHFVQQGDGKFLANLPALARQRLATLGVNAVYGNDGSAAWCTVTQRSRFFSHRRDAAVLGSSGRFAACIWLAR